MNVKKECDPSILSILTAENNNLTRRETALVVEKGLTVGGKSLQEYLEASNHAYALDWIRELAKRPDAVPSENELLQRHALILRALMSAMLDVTVMYSDDFGLYWVDG